MPHIEVYDAGFWAKELGQSVQSVQATHRIRLWERPGEERGKMMGQLLVGSRAEILSQQGDYYNRQKPAGRLVRMGEQDPGSEDAASTSHGPHAM